MNVRAWESTLDLCCRQYEPESVTVRCGRWSVRWMYLMSEAGVELHLWYVDRGGQFERVICARIPQMYPREDLPALVRHKMRAAEAMLEAQFTA